MRPETKGIPASAAALGTTGTWFFDDRRDVTFYKNAEGYVQMAGSESASSGDWASIVSLRPRDVKSFFICFYSGARNGVWAAKQQRRIVELVTYSYSTDGATSFTPLEEQECLTRLEAWMRESGFGVEVVASLMATGRYEWAENVWPGRLHNAASFAALFMFVQSLSWIPKAPAYVASARCARRLARGQCPRCRYSIVGLKGPLCPECGCVWDVAAAKDVWIGWPGKDSG